MELNGLCPVSAKLHDSLKYTKGTIYDSVINNGRKNVKTAQATGCIIGLHQERWGKSQPTGVILLTSDLFNLLKEIDIAWSFVKIREYVSNPMRCKNCQLLFLLKV